MERWLTLFAVLFVGCAAIPPAARGPGIAFALMGDTPYSTREVQQLDELIDQLNREELAFVVHVGDITSGRGPCTDEWFEARKRQFDRIRHPFVLLPGDNDWTDCHRSGMDPLERLSRFRQLFEAGDESLGQRKMPLERQSGDPRFSEYREHMRWIAGNVLFVGLNVQGSNNNLGRTPLMDEEYRRRMAAVSEWLDEAVKLTGDRELAGLVILSQANPDFEEHWRTPGAPDGFVEFRDMLLAVARRLGKPILFVHGDTHRYRLDRPLEDPESGERIANFTRLEVYGSPWVRWVRGMLYPTGPAPFSVAPAP